MVKDVNHRQREIVTYLRGWAEASTPLPHKQRVLRELGLGEQDLHAEVRRLLSYGYIEEIPDASEGLQYRVLLDEDGNPLLSAPPSYLRLGGTSTPEKVGQPADTAPKDPLTPTELVTLRRIHGFLRENGYPPTLDNLNARSLTAGVTQIRNHVMSLVEKGWIERLAGDARAIRLQPCALQLLGPITLGAPAPTISYEDLRLPVLGQIAAGEASPVGDDVPQETLQVPARLIQKYEATELFALRVRGASMEGRGILSGDYLVVRAQPRAESGEVVAAQFDPEDPRATVKTYQERGDRVWLEPANPDMGLEPIPADDARLQGKVIALLRFYEDHPFGWRIG